MSHDKRPYKVGDCHNSMDDPYSFMGRIKLSPRAVANCIKNYKVSESGCWEYQGLINDGYGRVRLCNIGLIPRYKYLRVHRISFAISKGIDPTGRMVLHSCDNPRCINPEHLFLGNNSINMLDMYSKERRIQKGEANNMAKLNERLVMQIVKKIRNGIGNRVIAKEFSVTHKNISLIRRGKTWRHVLSKINYEPSPARPR